MPSTKVKKPGARKINAVATEASLASTARRKRLPDDRISDLLDIAAEVFLAEGYAAASTNQIARLANASKTTFYSRFPTKQDLFLAVIERRMHRIFEQVANFPTALDVRESLQQFGSNLLHIALSPEQILLVRLVSMESSRHPELATRFYENGPGRGEQALATYLASQIEAGILRKEEPTRMASHLISMLAGGAVRWFVLGVPAKQLRPPALRRHIQDAVDLFLRAYQVP